MTQEIPRTSIWVWWAVGIVAAAALAVGLYLEFRPAPTSAPPPRAAAPAPRPAPEPAPEQLPAPPPPPMPAAAPANPLPALDESDNTVLGALMELLGQNAVQRFLIPEDIVRHIVVTIDNLPRQKLALQQRPINPTPGRFVTTGTEEEPVLDAENFTRYRPFMALLEATDANAAVGIYVRLYPLFEEAYQALGNPEGNFNSRLREVIDHLLATPELGGPIRLQQPNVMFVYADPALEGRSAGQKLLLRMGRENVLIVKAKLREVRAALP
jgi:hypothetical protein